MQRSVEVWPFLIARTEVTQAAWEQVMGASPSKYQGPTRPVESVAWQRASGSRSYVVEIVDHGTVVWTDLVRGPSLDRELSLPVGRTYVWRVYAVLPPTRRPGAAGPIARGTLVLR